MTKKNWVPFWFESNLFFDEVRTPEDWKRVLAAYPGKEEWLLDNARLYEASHHALPDFGIRSEHRINNEGAQTLGEFFRENGMESVSDRKSHFIMGTLGFGS